MEQNIALLTDSYKLAHWQQYQPDTEVVYSYFESREGAKFDETVFFGLQYLIKKYLMWTITMLEVDEAEAMVEAHLGDKRFFNRKMWEHIVDHHDGRLPVEIKAVPEGTPVPTSNVMMTIENSCPQCAPLTNHLETILCHLWYSCTVATLSRETKRLLARYFDETSTNLDGLDFMLHDFGFRGASSVEAAGIGGLAHLVNFKGTDTVAALMVAQAYYDYQGACAVSVPATEHSVMTSLGPDGEEKIIGQLLDTYPTGILSVVSDSYDYFHTLEKIVGETYRNRILEREGIFVVRPDSGDPVDTVIKSLDILWDRFGGAINMKGYKVLNPKIRVLWGDGLDLQKIGQILYHMKVLGWSAENIATFGMGGGLLQKINRDTQRFAFKCSAQRVGGVWRDTFKDPKDSTKKSKRGKLALVPGDYGLMTVPAGGAAAENLGDLLVPVYRNGVLLVSYTLDEIRERAAL